MATSRRSHTVDLHSGSGGLCRGIGGRIYAVIIACFFFPERAHQDLFECCASFNKHGTSGLVAMMSASHAEGRQFDPGLVYIYALRASVRHCATCRTQRDLRPPMPVCLL